VSAPPRLALRGLTSGRDGVAVARDVDVELSDGEVLAILGPNGAGKTTTLLTIAGLLPALSGSVLVDGDELRSGSARRANRAGVVLVPDNRALFTELTPTEHLRLAAHWAALVDEVLELFPPLVGRASVPAGALSGGEQQMLAIARALVQEPRVLLIDEMSMGLAPVVVESLLPVIRRVADERDAAVVLVEQHVHLTLAVADRALVLVHGDVTLSGPASEVRADALALEAAYLGGTTGATR
jgi:branched-chain amino acid transport system ATP-binding protein